MKPVRTFVCSFFAAIAMVALFALPAIGRSVSPAVIASPSGAPSGVVSPGLTMSPSASASASASPSSSTSAVAGKKPGPPILGAGGWGKYMAITMIGISALIVLALLAGLALQAPGFRRADGDAE